MTCRFSRLVHSELIVLVLAICCCACAAEKASTPLSPLANTSPFSTMAPVERSTLVDATGTGLLDIAFLSDRDGGLAWYQMKSDGSSVQPLPLPSGSSVQGLWWLPEIGQWAAVLGDGSGQGDIYLIAPSGAIGQRLTSSRHIKSDLSYSERSGKLAFICADEYLDVCTVSVSGHGAVVNITSSPAQEISPLWSPDGTRLLFVSDVAAIQDVWLMSGDGTNLANLTATGHAHGSPSWSPDGSQILFSSQRDLNWEIYVMGPQGQNPRNLTNNPARDTVAVWSPDGNHIAFRSDRDGNQEIYTMAVDGNDLQNVTQTSESDESVFAWSPDSQALLIVSDPGTNSDIYWVRRDGSGRANLTNHPDSDVAPIWISAP